MKATARGVLGPTSGSKLCRWGLYAVDIYAYDASRRGEHNGESANARTGEAMRGFTTASFIVLVLVVLVVGTAAVLLAKTVQNAQRINDKAQHIAKTGTGINAATDSVVQLNRTNALAESILRSANPLERQLDGIVGTAKSIDGLAGSINGTAGAINDSAQTINGTATDINSSAGDINSAAGSINQSAGSIDASAGAINQRAGAINASAGSINTSANRIDGLAASILGTARAVDRDVSLINRNLDVSLNIVSGVKSDTANILRQAVGAHDTAACIDAKLNGGVGAIDGDCKAQGTPASKTSLDKLPKDARTPEGFRKLLRDTAALQRSAKGALGGNIPGVGGNVPDPDANVPDPDAGAQSPSVPGDAGAGQQGGQDRGNIIDRLFPGVLGGQAGSGK